MSTHFIFTADDFGPIDFVNDGICRGVQKGLINSVQVLVNGDTEDRLTEKLDRLRRCIPAGRELDLGLHLTLTSGKPLTGGNAPNQLWGDMLINAGSDGHPNFFFRDYSNFNFGYTGYLPVIEDEFIAQRERLENALKAIGAPNLKLSSISNHHNMLSISEDLFETYLRVANYQNRRLTVRSPKCLPRLSTHLYYTLILPNINSSDSSSQAVRMHQLNKAFLNNRYTGKDSLRIKSPNYIDVAYYKSLGSAAVFDMDRKKYFRREVRKRKTKFADMLRRADRYMANPEIEPDKKVIEFVFHLGYCDNGDENYNDMVRHYPGVTPKFFDNRLVELQALEELRDQDQQHFDKAVSWLNCGEIHYRV